MLSTLKNLIIGNRASIILKIARDSSIQDSFAHSPEPSLHNTVFKGFEGVYLYCIYQENRNTKVDAVSTSSTIVLSNRMFELLYKRHLMHSIIKEHDNQPLPHLFEANLEIIYNWESCIPRARSLKLQMLTTFASLKDQQLQQALIDYLLNQCKLVQEAIPLLFYFRGFTLEFKVVDENDTTARRLVIDTELVIDTSSIKTRHNHRPSISDTNLMRVEELHEENNVCLRWAVIRKNLQYTSLDLPNSISIDSSSIFDWSPFNPHLSFCLPKDLQVTTLVVQAMPVYQSGQLFIPRWAFLMLGLSPGIEVFVEWIEDKPVINSLPRPNNLHVIQIIDERIPPKTSIQLINIPALGLIGPLSMHLVDRTWIIVRVIDAVIPESTMLYMLDHSIITNSLTFIRRPLLNPKQYFKLNSLHDQPWAKALGCFHEWLEMTFTEWFKHSHDLTGRDCQFRTKGVHIVGPSGSGKTFFLLQAFEGQPRRPETVFHLRHFNLEEGEGGEESKSLQTVYDRAKHLISRQLVQLPLSIEGRRIVLVIDPVDRLFTGTSYDDPRSLPDSEYSKMEALVLEFVNVIQFLARHGVMTVITSNALTFPWSEQILSTRYSLFPVTLYMPTLDVEERRYIMEKEMFGLLSTSEALIVKSCYKMWAGDMARLVEAGRVRQQTSLILKGSPFAPVPALYKTPIPWDLIPGLSFVKARLEELFVWPMQHKSKFREFDLPLSAQVLLYGPSGTGKTILALALAEKCGYSGILVQGPELFNRYIGSTERALRNVFTKARARLPCLIIFDQIEAMGLRRGSSATDSGLQDRLVNQLLTELDGASANDEQLSRGGVSIRTDFEEGEHDKDGLFVIATCSEEAYEMLDPALVRSGRIDTHFYLGLPDTRARSEIIEHYLTKKKALIRYSAPILPEWILKETEGWSGAELGSLMTNLPESQIFSQKDDLDQTLRMALEEYRLFLAPQIRDKHGEDRKCSSYPQLRQSFST